MVSMFLVLTPPAANPRVAGKRQTRAAVCPQGSQSRGHPTSSPCWDPLKCTAMLTLRSHRWETCFLGHIGLALNMWSKWSSPCFCKNSSLLEALLQSSGPAPHAGMPSLWSLQLPPPSWRVQWLLVHGSVHVPCNCPNPTTSSLRKLFPVGALQGLS